MGKPMGRLCCHSQKSTLSQRSRTYWGRFLWLMLTFQLSLIKGSTISRLEALHFTAYKVYIVPLRGSTIFRLEPLHCSA